MKAKAFSITVPASTGNQAYSIIGFQPKVVMFFGVRRASVGASGSATQNDDMPYFFGAAASSTKRAVVYMPDVFAFTCRSSTKTNRCIYSVGLTANDTEGSTHFEADLVSMDANGFTLNWVTANATAYQVFGLALGGADLTDADVITWSPTGSSNYPSTQNVGGLSFQPDSVLVACDNRNDGTSALCAPGFGFMVSTTNRGTLSSGWDNASGYASKLVTSKAITVFSGHNIREGDLDSFDADGFNIDWDFVPSETTTTALAVCLKGGSFTVLQQSARTSTGNQAITGAGFKPAAAFLMSVGKAANAGVDTTSPLSVMIGVTDGVNQFVAYAGGGANAGVTEIDNAACYTNRSDATSPTLNAKASIVSMDADGLTLNYGTADATARSMLLFLFGPAESAAGGPPVVSARSHVRQVPALMQFAR